jgi:hypothetical protein
MRLGRKPGLTPHQKQEALLRKENGEAVREIARSYNVHESTISRLIHKLDTLRRSNGLDIDDWDAPIYRVFKLCWFKDMITQGRNGLLRPSKWGDPFENFFLKCKVQSQNGEIGCQKPIHDGWYGQCWTMHADSDAMWRIYSRDKRGVRVSTTIRKLFTAICDTNDKFARHKYYIGRVKYQSRAEIECFLRATSYMELTLGDGMDGFARTLCIKRREFAHEKELRVLIYDVDDKGCGDVLNVPFVYYRVLCDAVLDPRLDLATFENLRKELSELGCRLPITQSDLYRMDEITIPLEPRAGLPT